MNEGILGSVIVKELAVASPTLSPFFLFNLICALAVATFCLTRFFSNNYVLARLSFCLAAFMFFLYQAPLVLFSEQVIVSLSQPWTYALIVNGSALALTLWAILSRRLDFYDGPCFFPEKSQLLYLGAGALGLGALWIYLAGVPWRCTGLFALLYDPWLTLVAREFSIKLIGTSLATYSFGAYANAIAPLLVLLSVWLIRNSLLRLRFVGALIGITGGILAIFAVLLSGTKGLLVPSLLMVMAGSYFWCNTWFSRIATTLFAFAFVVFSLITFELMKERSSVVGGAYDFAACSKTAGTCNMSLEMLESMKARDHSLGLPGAFVAPIQSRLVCLCSGDGDQGTCPAGTLGQVMGGQVMGGQVMGGQVMGGQVMGGQHLTHLAERSATLGGAIFNRVFVVPFQVSVWNFMYAETEPVDGAKTLPFARRIFRESLNMPELVYQKYGSIYSMGDKTSTSTAPTSFLLAYPIYVGWIGFALAMVCVIALDFVLARLARFIGATLLPILIGTVLIMSINFMTSDFVTVLISHGGAAGIFALLFYAALTNRKLC